MTTNTNPCGTKRTNTRLPHLSVTVGFLTYL